MSMFKININKYKIKYDKNKVKYKICLVKSGHTHAFKHICAHACIEYFWVDTMALMVSSERKAWETGRV